MLLHTPSLLVAFALVLVLASAASVSVGLKQQSRRGARWWVVANAILAAALTLQSGVDPTAVGAPIAAVLALQWPIVMLGGMRRFYARGGTRISEWSDRSFSPLAALVRRRLGPADRAGEHAQVRDGAIFADPVRRGGGLAASTISRPAPTLKRCSWRTDRRGRWLQAAWLADRSRPLGPRRRADLALGASCRRRWSRSLMPQLALVHDHERTVAQLRASHRKLRHLVDVDALTRLPNRRHFHELSAQGGRAEPGRRRCWCSMSSA